MQNKLIRIEKKKLTISTWYGALHRNFETIYFISSFSLLETGPPQLLSLIFDQVSSRNLHIELLTNSFSSWFSTGALFRPHFESKASTGHSTSCFLLCFPLPSRTTGTGYDMTNIPKLDVCHALHRLIIKNLKQKHTKHTKIFSLFFFFSDRN